MTPVQAHRLELVARKAIQMEDTAEAQLLIQREIEQLDRECPICGCLTMKHSDRTNECYSCGKSC